MMTSDLILVGHLGDNAIAAAALAQTVLFAAFMIGMGLMAAVSPLAAQAYGAREPRMVRRALRVGLWAAVLLGVPMTALQYMGEDILCARSGRTTRQRGWPAAICSVSAGAWCRAGGSSRCAASWVRSTNRSRLLWITLAAIPVNALLAYALIHGAFGLPRLDLLGAGARHNRRRISACASAGFAVCLCAAAVPKIPACSATSGASTGR